MSELTNNLSSRKNFRWQLLTTVSALAVLGAAQCVANAADTDGDRPTVWIELGGQLERVDTHEDQFVPPFILATPRPGPETVSPLTVDHLPRYSIAGEGKVSFEPTGSDWVFSAAVRYGRSKNDPHLLQQSLPTQPVVPPATAHASPQFLHAFQFVDTEAHHSESHMLLDFQAGKDFGIGFFGNGSSSLLSLGVRFAQFESKSSITFGSDPDSHPLIKYFGTHEFFQGTAYHFNSAKETAARSFHGIGPSVSWNGSVPALGRPEGGEITLDWGANAAVLFGRQKALVHHQATAQFRSGVFDASNLRTTLYQHSTDVPPRSRSVVVPNVGGFAGLSARYSNAKISFGYRADFFFGAVDAGIDAGKRENVGFYGPFASVSIGLGG